MSLRRQSSGATEGHLLPRLLLPQGKDARLVAIDLFAGCGALSLGLSRAGFRLAAAVEIDPKLAATYRLNHPSTRVLEKDVRLLSGTDLLDAASLRPGEVSLVAGCPPCQGFSRIRRRNGSRAARDN